MTTELPDFVAVQNRVVQFEETFQLLDYKLDDWCIWPVLRFGVITALRGLPFSRRRKMPPISVGRLLIRDLGGVLHLHNAHLMVHTNSLPLAEQVEGMFKDIYFDDLLLSTGSYFKLEDAVYQTSEKNRRKMLVKSHMTSTLFHKCSSLLSRIYKPLAIQRISQVISELLQEELKLKDWTLKRIALSLSHFYWLKKMYHVLLTNIQPKYLLLITSYVSLASIAAAKELNIQVVEFQHGFLDRFHPGYSWRSTSVPYKPFMPLPDRIFLYGSYWKDELIATGFWSEELNLVGSLRVDEYRQATLPKLQFPTLVLTTQHMSTEPLIKFLKRFLCLANKIAPVRLFIKLHPAEQAEQAEMYVKAFQNDEHTQVLSSQDAPSTFALLKQSHYHLSISSTCHYESLALGVPTIILPFASSESVIHLCKTGYAFFASTPEELCDFVLRNPYRSVPQTIGNHFFASDALANMKNKLDLRE